MRCLSRDVLTIDDHRRYGQALLELRRRQGAITRTLSGRVPTRVLDAALDVDRQLATLCLRLADAVSDGATAGAYMIESPVIESPVIESRPSAATRHLSVDEHRIVGAELYRLRSRVMALATALSGYYAKSSRVGRALHKPERAIDRLRCRLDDLFCAQHREQFDTRVYYPGANQPLPTSDGSAVGGVW